MDTPQLTEMSGADYLAVKRGLAPRLQARWFVPSLSTAGAMKCLACKSLVDNDLEDMAAHWRRHQHENERHSAAEGAVA
jgi:hypothetical protein